MTAAPLDIVHFTAVTERAGPRAKYLIETLGTFGLLSTVGLAIGTANPFAAVGIGAVLVGLIYTGFQAAGGHFNPAITAAALWWGRITVRQAVAYWCAQFVAGVCAAVAVSVVVGAGQPSAAMAMMLSGRALMAAMAAQLLFTFVLGYVVFSCASPRRRAPNMLSDCAIGVAVLASVVDGSTLFGDAFLVSQVIAGAFTGIAFLAFGSAAR
jgi:aquaporin Z